MQFEWDEAKNRQNIDKHGVSFGQATRIFESFTVDRIDDRFLYNEIREFSLGLSGQTLVLAVIHTDRQGVCRIISARRANKTEKTRYEEALQKAFKP